MLGTLHRAGLAFNNLLLTALRDLSRLGHGAALCNQTRNIRACRPVTAVLGLMDYDF